MPFAIAAGVAAGSAIAAGAAVTVGGVVAIAAGAAVAAGLVMTVVGAATGDKGLMKIGGLVGLAGGVAGAAGSLVGGAAEAGAGAAGEAAASSAGESAISAAGNAVSPAASAISEAATAGNNQALTQTGLSNSNGATSIATGGGAGDQAGSLGLGASAFNGPGSSGPAPTSGISMANPATANSGVVTPKTVNLDLPGAPQLSPVKAPNNPATNQSWLDFLTSPKGLTGAGQLASGAFNGMNQHADAQVQTGLLAQAQNYNQFMDQRGYANANSPGTMNMSATNPTPAQIAQYKLDQARLAKNQAGILTQPAVTP